MPNSLINGTSSLEVRKSTMADVEQILFIIGEARKKMQAEGNLQQWSDGHPSRKQIETDIRHGVSYVLSTVTDGLPQATFALIPGPDPTYATVYDGAWLNDHPYAVIHRIASTEKVHGVLALALRLGFQLFDTVRIDTHQDNRTMRRLLKKYGFSYCGIILLENGDPRLAFQKTIATK